MTNTDGFAVSIGATFAARAVEPIHTTTNLAGLLADHGAAIAVDQDGTGFHITLSIDNTRSAISAIEQAMKLVRAAATEAQLPRWSAHSVEALTYEEQDRQLAEPVLPELLGTAELAQMLGVSKTRVGQLRDHDLFPHPVAQLASGPVYTLPSVSRFADNWKRSPGRPAKTSAG